MTIAPAALPPSPKRDELLATTHIALGTTQRLRGKYDQALDSLRSAAHIAHQSHLDPALIAAAGNALGVLAKDTGRYDDAAHHYADAIIALDRVADRHHPLHATVQHNLAGLAHSRGRFTEGEAPARRAVELRRHTRFAAATDIAADQTVLGAILAGGGHHEEAEALFRHAITVWSAHYTEDHYEVAVNLHNLAPVQQARGDLTGAENSFSAALAIKQRLLGSHHPEIGTLLNNLAALAAQQGHPNQAGDLYGRALIILDATLGPDHPHTRACGENRTQLATRWPSSQ